MVFKVHQFAQFSIAATVVGAAMLVAPTQASAFSLNGWDYAVADQGNGTGGKVFDYRGMAIKDAGDSITIAINGYMDLNGYKYHNEVINHGDLFLNFTGKSFKEASDAGELFAVNFAQFGSQTGAASTGIYANVKAKSTTSQNYGWNNLTDWKKAVNGKTSYGDLTADSDYFKGMQTGSQRILNAIDTGKKIGNIMMMNNAELASAGLNFGNFGVDGTQTLGFKFQKTEQFQVGKFVASLFMECGNDGVAIESQLSAVNQIAARRQKVPEPASIAGITTAVVASLGWRRRQRRLQNA